MVLEELNYERMTAYSVDMLKRIDAKIEVVRLGCSPGR
jgi:hypothetical protein